MNPILKKMKTEDAIKLSILKELEIHTIEYRRNDHENHPNQKDYLGLIHPSDFGNLVQDLQDDELIRGAVIVNLEATSCVFWDTASITGKGKQYLKDNAAAIKLYKGLKEVQSWVDTVTGVINAIKP